MIKYHNQYREENKLLQDHEQDLNNQKHWSLSRFLSGGSLRNPTSRTREIKAPKNRVGLKRQLVNEAFESRRMQKYQTLVERSRASLISQEAPVLADISLNSDQYPPRRQAALVQLLKRGAFGRLRQILALESSKQLQNDSNLQTAFFNLHKTGAFLEEEVVKRAPDLAMLSFDIDATSENSPRILLKVARAEDLMKTLGNTSLKTALEFDISTWRIALGLKPQGEAEDLPPSAQNDLAMIELRREMISKIQQIVKDKDLKYHLTSAHIELFEKVLKNKHSFTSED